MQMCAIAEVSRKSYYYYLKGMTKPDPDDEIVKLIKEIQDHTGFGCGYRQITMQLNSRYEVGPINEKRVYRLMQEHNLLSSVRRKKFTPEQYLRRRERKENVPPNLLKRDFFSGAPRQIFCTDITYLLCLEQTWYFCAIEDLFNGELVGYAVSNNIDTQLTIDSVLNMVATIGQQKNAIIHSDQGSVYTAYEYKDKVKNLGFRQSCSYVGQCWENACAESFNGILKTECFYNRFGKTKFKERRISQAKVLPLIDEWIPYYNEVRCKDYLGGMSPVEFRERNPRGTLPVVISQDSKIDFFKEKYKI